MTAAVSATDALPSPQAQPHATMNADGTALYGFQRIAKRIQSAYAFKGGLIAADVIEKSTVGRYTTPDAFVYFLIKTPVYGDLNTAVRIRVYADVERATTSGSWQLNASFDDGTTTANLTVDNSTTGRFLDDLGTLTVSNSAFDDDADTQILKVGVNLFSAPLNQSTSYLHGLFFAHEFSGSALPTVVGGYNRAVYPINTSYVAKNDAAAVAYLAWLKNMAEDIYKRRVATLYSSTLTTTVASGASETVSIMQPYVPKGVTSLTLWFRITGGDALATSSAWWTYSGSTTTRTYGASVMTENLTYTVNLDEDDREPLITVSGNNVVFRSMMLFCDDRDLP